jgi:excisionase family DNA binding protein
MMRPKEVAELLGLTNMRVYQLMRDGEIPSTVIGGAIRIPRAAWNAWLEQKTQDALGREK